MSRTYKCSAALTVTTTPVADVARIMPADTRPVYITPKIFGEQSGFTDVTQFLLTGHVNAIVADTADGYTDADLYNVWVPMTISARPEVVYLKSTGTKRILRLRPVPCRIDTGVLKLVGGPPDEGVRLVANTDAITFAGDNTLLYDVAFGKSTINGVEVDFADMNFTFEAPFADTTVDLATVPRVY